MPVIWQALADCEEKHGMDHPITARMAWRLGLYPVPDKEAMLLQAARTLIDCLGLAHEAMWACLSELQLHLLFEANDADANNRNSARWSHPAQQMMRTMIAGMSGDTTYWWTKPCPPGQRQH